MSQYGLLALDWREQGTLVPRGPYDQVRLRIWLTGVGIDAGP